MELREVLRPTLNITLATVITALTGLFFWLLATKFYSPQEIGMASAVISFLNLTFAVSTLGLNVGLIRFYSKYGKKATGTTLIVMLASSLIMTTAYVLTNPGGMVGESRLFQGIVYITCIAGAVYNALGAISIPARRTGVYLEMSAIYGLRIVPLPFLRDLGAYGLIGSVAVGLTVGFLYGLVRLRDYISLGFETDFLRESLGISISNYVGNTVNILPMYLMPTLILVHLGKEWAGYYYVGFTVGNLMMVPIMALSTILIREGNGKSYFRRSTALVIAYWVITLITTGFLGSFLLGIFGEDYLRALAMVKAIAVGIGPFGMVYLGIARLTVENASRGVFTINVIRGSLFLVLGYLLLYPYGITGVGIAWTLAHTVAVLVLCGSYFNPKTF